MGQFSSIVNQLDPESWINRRFRDLERAIQDLRAERMNVTTTREGWRVVGASGQPGFQNGWVNYDAANWSPTSFRKTGGVVYLRGLVKNGTVGGATPMFTLPAGYRPTIPAIVTTSSADMYGQLRIYADGRVCVNTGSNIWVSLDGISFTGEQ